MNVLSLFDGMSCGQQALERAGIKVDKYFASEIDKYAIKVTMANYPDTIQLGSVVDVNGYDLPKIDMLIGGSPCQSFSFAGKRKGMSTKCETEILTLNQYLEMKSEGFEFEGQSYLFWEYMRLLNEVKPKYFLLENVIMGEKWEKILSKAIGVNSIEINSSLLSAQNRRRLYWTNIGMQPRGFFGDLESIIKQPKDKLILLKDILEDEVDEKYFLSDKSIDYINRNKRNLAFQMDENDEKSSCITAVFQKQIPYNQIVVHNLQKRSADRPAIQKNKNAGGSGHLSREDGKTYCLDMGNTQAVEIKRRIIVHDIPEIVSVRKFEVNILSLQKTLKEHKKLNNQQIADALEVPKTNVEHWFRTDTYFSIPDKDIWLKLKEILEIKTDEFDESIMNFEEKEGVFEKGNRVYDENGIFPTLTTMSENDRIINNSRIRRLTPIECERLQTVKDNYTNHVSDSQRYKMLGNGWTVDVIAYIFSYIDK
ncbi:MAG: DNA cytosine methyltransferase [Bacteroidia bacterium]|nr:DNA cytosine methyltransferase [Bacteroidia bacterium]